MGLKYDMLEVRFEHEPVEHEKYVVVYGWLDTGQLELLDAIEVGPFPDWEVIARRVMRHTIRCGAASLG